MKVLLIAVCIAIGVAAMPSGNPDLDTGSDIDYNSQQFQYDDDMDSSYHYHYEKDGWIYDENFDSYALRSDIFDRTTICNFKAWDFFKECIHHETLGICRNEKNKYLDSCLGNSTYTT